MRRSIPAVSAVAFVAMSCAENLPNGPQTFLAQLKIVVPHDTLVVGDSSAAQAQALDASGNRIQSLAFSWASADSGIVGLATPASPDTSAGRIRRFVGQRIGRSNVTLSLPDPRFVSTPTSRVQTVVVGGVRILTTHDSTLTAINDTAVAVAAGLVRVNGTLVARGGQGVKWVHLGFHTTVVTLGDTARYISKSNGPDTLIATSDFCLAGAKCADTVVVRVSQVLVLALSSHAFRSWSFADSLTPTITLADRRGNGLAGTSIRFVPLGPADSLVVGVGPVVGFSDPATGTMATPRLISIGNGSATVAVRGMAADGVTILATDTVTEVVRQVARYANVEALRALMSTTASIPMKAVARDARGAVIADAIVSVASPTVGVPFNPPFAGPAPILNVSVLGVLTPTITGIALPDSNPLAPQIPVNINAAQITVLKADTVKAGQTTLAVPIFVLDSTALPAVNATIVFGTSNGVAPLSVITDFTGSAIATWVPPNVAATYTLTGVRPSNSGLATLADSTGRIVVRRDIVVIAGDPDPSLSTVEITATTIAHGGAATVTVRVRDIFGNIATNATPADFAATTLPGRGAVGAFTCTLGVCTATYTAPATAGGDAISVKIGGVEIVFSPLALNIT
jgi:hypothetical protein